MPPSKEERFSSVLRLPTRFGTAGGVQLEHEVSVDNGTRWASECRSRNRVRVRVSRREWTTQSLSSLGQAIFDVEAGVLRNELNVQGALNTSVGGNRWLLPQPFVLVRR